MNKNNLTGKTIGYGRARRVVGTPEQERLRGERNARMAALRAGRCPACRGTGGGIYNDCGYCGGNGVV